MERMYLLQESIAQARCNLHSSHRQMSDPQQRDMVAVQLNTTGSVQYGHKWVAHPGLYLTFLVLKLDLAIRCASFRKDASCEIYESATVSSSILC